MTTRETMRAMVFTSPGAPLQLSEVARPTPARGQVLVRVTACAVCRTDLHVIDGELRDPVVPLIPGHEIVGTVVAHGVGVTAPALGERVGIPWLGWTCDRCAFCTSGRENLCDEARFTGYTLPGGYAEFVAADARYCFPLAGHMSPIEAAPLLCAGLIGHRALRMAGDARCLGIYGFGAAAHYVAQVARHEGRECYAFTRPGDRAAQDFALSLGAVWAGDSDSAPPVALDAAIIFAPVGPLVPAALRAVTKGGTVVCGGIHMSDIPAFPYEILWGERSVRSVANLTRRDGEEFLELAARIPIRSEVVEYPLTRANEALADLRSGALQGAAVLRVAEDR